MKPGIPLRTGLVATVVFASLCLQQRRRLQKSLFAVNQQRKACFGQALDNE